MNTVILEDEITLYWDKQWELPDGVEYLVVFDGKEVVTTVKTHFSFRNLRKDTCYEIEIYRINDKGERVETMYEGTLRTLVARKRIDVTKPPYHAVGDGKTLNTAALQKALDDCKAGETLYFPEGVYLSGSLYVHSDTEIYIDANAVLKGTESEKDYLPIRKSRFEGIERECYSALLNVGQMDSSAGYTTKNIVIRGKGSIYGGGKELCWAVINAEREKRKADFPDDVSPEEKRRQNVELGRFRPRLISINNCENVLITGLHIGYGAAWNVHILYSKNVVTYGCTLQSEGVWNGDGWNPDSSENCTIFNTIFCTHDDAVAIKSGKNPQGNVIARPTKNVRVFDCQGKNGVAVGSELSGGIENVFVWDCKLMDGVAGFRTKTTRKRGGYVKNVKIRNCELVDIRVWTGYPCNDDGEGAGYLTKLENFSFENVKVTGYSTEPSTQEAKQIPPVLLWGFDEKAHYIQGLKIKNLGIYSRKDNDLQSIAIKNVTGISIENIDFIYRG